MFHYFSVGNGDGADPVNLDMHDHDGWFFKSTGFAYAVSPDPDVPKAFGWQPFEFIENESIGFRTSLGDVIVRGDFFATLKMSSSPVINRYDAHNIYLIDHVNPELTEFYYWQISVHQKVSSIDFIDSEIYFHNGDSSDLAKNHDPYLFEIVDGHSHNSFLEGSAAKASITGSSNNDIIATNIFKGIQELDGSAGYDTAIIDKPLEEYELVSYNGTTLSLREKVEIAPQIIRMSEIELFEFADAPSLTLNDLLDKYDSEPNNGSVDDLPGWDGNDGLPGGGDENNDVLTGTPEGDTFSGDPGDDTFIGLGGYDVATYFSSFFFGGTAGIEVDLTAGTVRDPFGDTDTVTSIEIFVGTRFDDKFLGGDGDDLFQGLAGFDTFNGGSGTDTVTFGTPEILGELARGIIVNMSLANEQVIDDGFSQQETLVSIENVIGTKFADTVTGNDLPNVLVGILGQDILRGRGGNDTLSGDQNNDQIHGDEGLDTALYRTVLTDSDIMPIADADPATVGDQPGWQVTTGFDGADKLVGVEILMHGVDSGHAVVRESVGRFLLVGNGGFATADDAAAASTHPGDIIRFAELQAEVVIEQSSATADLILTFTGDTPVHITTGSGDDRVSSGVGEDTIDTGDGDDHVAGGSGNDKLTGGNGGDAFLFDTNISNQNVVGKLDNEFNLDHITDFKPGADIIELSKSIFTRLDEDALKKKQFFCGKDIEDAGKKALIAYSKKSGELAYVADNKEVLFAILDKSPNKLRHQDFDIVA